MSNELFLGVDVGGSQTKVIYQKALSSSSNSRDSCPRYLLMPPQIELIRSTKLERYLERKGWIGTPAPEQQVWGSWNEETFVVGSLASQFDKSERLRELKYENALYKILGIIGVLAEKEQLDMKKTLKVHLAVLLPWNEYSDRARFESQLSKMLTKFSVRGQPLKVKLAYFLLRPEGAGLAASYLRIKGKEYFSKRRLGVLMLGHRNVTSLYFENGELKSGSSPLLGFAQFLERVIDVTSGLDSQRLMKAIFQVLHEANSEIERLEKVGTGKLPAYTIHPQWERYSAIKELASARNEQLREQEIKDLGAAIRESLQEYWEELSKWLKQSLPTPLDEVMISGGTAKFLEPELEEYFNNKHSVYRNVEFNGSVFITRGRDIYTRDPKRPHTPIRWGAQSVNVMERTVSIYDVLPSQEGLKERLVDVFSLFDYMIESENRRESQKSA